MRTMETNATPTCDTLTSLFHLSLLQQKWHDERATLKDQLAQCRQHCQSLAAQSNAQFEFHRSLWEHERAALLEMIQCHCREKLAWKKIHSTASSTTPTATSPSILSAAGHSLAASNNTDQMFQLQQQQRAQIVELELLVSSLTNEKSSLLSLVSIKDSTLDRLESENRALREEQSRLQSACAEMRDNERKMTQRMAAMHQHQHQHQT